MNIFHTAKSLNLNLLIFVLYARRAHEVSLSQDGKKNWKGKKVRREKAKIFTGENEPKSQNMWQGMKGQLDSKNFWVATGDSLPWAFYIYFVFLWEIK